MKFAHISDTHLGFSQFGTGERAKDVYNAFLQAIDISIKEKVEFVVFAGDIFHTPTPDGTAIINMAHALKKLQDVQIPAYFILGEHDISHAMLHPVPFVYHKLGYAVHVGEKPACKLQSIKSRRMSFLVEMLAVAAYSFTAFHCDTAS